MEISYARRARALLRAIISDDPHLSYEQIEALAEGKVELAGPLLAHVRGCGTCHTELRDMQTFVTAFRIPGAGQRSSWQETLRGWFERPLQLGGAVAAVAAICVAVAVVEKNESRHTGINNINATHAIVVDEGQHAPTADDCSARELASSSAQWYELYESGEFQQLVRALHEPAAAGNTTAQTTLGTLMARGLGTQRDAASAQMWLQKAAARGDTCARQVLATLD
jgi:hypothetical protein